MKNRLFYVSLSKYSTKPKKVLTHTIYQSQPQMPDLLYISISHHVIGILANINFFDSQIQENSGGRQHF